MTKAIASILKIFARLGRTSTHCQHGRGGDLDPNRGFEGQCGAKAAASETCRLDRPSTTEATWSTPLASEGRCPPPTEAWVNPGKSKGYASQPMRPAATTHRSTRMASEGTRCRGDPQQKGGAHHGHDHPLCSASEVIGHDPVEPGRPSHMGDTQRRRPTTC